LGSKIVFAECSNQYEHFFLSVSATNKHTGVRLSIAL